ncbi:hypothetical protein RDABS01_035489 [Bienertia sinuspersici]
MARSNTQRLDQLEQDLQGLKTDITAQVTAAVAEASKVMQQTLAEQITASLEQATRRLGEDLEKGRGAQEQMIAQIQSDQRELREEVRRSIEALKKNGEGETSL